jgi:iron transport multicopper oxidase
VFLAHSIPLFGGGTSTVTSDQDKPESGIVWMIDVREGLLLYKAALVNGSLVETTLPVFDGAKRYNRPVFVDSRMHVFDAKGVMIVQGAQ